MPSVRSRQQGLRIISFGDGEKAERLAEGNRSGGAHVLVRELVDHLLQIGDRNLGIVLEDVVVNRAGCTLDGRVGVEIEIILKWMSDIALNKSTGEGVRVAIASLAVAVLGEETNVVTLGTNDDGPLDLF